MLIFALVVALCRAQQPPLMNLRLLSNTDATCLDGSPAGYYIQSNPGVTKWVVSLMGGGWCTSLADCVGRSTTSLGSSKAWSSAIYGWSMISTNVTENPFFASWNHVFVPYCDGASFSGNVDGGVTVGNATLYFRGKTVLESVFADLLNAQSLSAATEVLLTGCSAGGLSTFLHADRVRAWLPAAAKFGGVPISGFFLNTTTYSTHKFEYGDQMRTVVKMQNATAGLPQACVKQNSADPAVCIFAAKALETIESPLFIMNSLYDNWQMNYVVGLDSPAFAPCAHSLSNCSQPTLARMNQFRDEMLALLQSRSTSIGLALDACDSHCEFDNPKGFAGLSIRGVLGQKAVVSWWRQNFAKPAHLVDCTLKTNKNCNPKCSLV